MGQTCDVYRSDGYSTVDRAAFGKAFFLVLLYCIDWGKIGVYLRSTFILQYPLSMTYRMPSTVNDVSAMLVDTMHFRAPSGAGSNILACRSEGSWE